MAPTNEVVAVGEIWSFNGPALGAVAFPAGTTLEVTMDRGGSGGSRSFDARVKAVPEHKTSALIKEIRERLALLEAEVAKAK